MQRGLPYVLLNVAYRKEASAPDDAEAFALVKFGVCVSAA